MTCHELEIPIRISAQITVNCCPLDMSIPLDSLLPFCTVCHIHSHFLWRPRLAAITAPASQLPFFCQDPDACIFFACQPVTRKGLTGLNLTRISVVVRKGHNHPQTTHKDSENLHWDYGQLGYMNLRVCTGCCDWHASSC